MKINNCRGGLTDISAKKQALIIITHPNELNCKCLSAEMV